MNQCKLCGQEKKLIRKSHIISKFLFRDLFEKKPKNHIIQIDVLNLQKKPMQPSDALYDSDLFCSDCDGNNNNLVATGMGIYEDYYKKYIRNEQHLVDNSNEISWHIYKDYDFNKFYLFFQIQIFRAAMSKRKEFEMVNISPRLLERIRKNIYFQNTHNKTNEIAILKLSEKSNYKNFIGSFQKVDTDYHIFLRGFIVFYLFDNKNYFYDKLKNHIIKDEQTVAPIVPLDYEEEFIKSLIAVK